MIRKTILLVASLGFAGAALADFPLMNAVADKVSSSRKARKSSA